MTRSTMVGALLLLGASSLQAQSSDNPGASGGATGGGATGSLAVGVPTPGGNTAGSAPTAGGVPTTAPTGVSNAVNAAVGGQPQAGGQQQSTSVSTGIPGGGNVVVSNSAIQNFASVVTTGSPSAVQSLANQLSVDGGGPSTDAGVSARGPAAPEAERQDAATALATSLATFADGVTLDELKAATAAYNAYVTYVVSRPGRDMDASRGPTASGDERATVPPITYVIRKTLRRLSAYGK